MSGQSGAVTGTAQPPAARARPPYPYLPAYRAPVPLADDCARRSTIDSGLDEAGRARAARLLASAPGISLHDHPIRLPQPLTPQAWSVWRSSRREELGHEGLRRAGLGAVFASAHPYDSVEDIWTWIGRLRADVAHQDGLWVAETAADLRAVATGGASAGTAVLLALETLDAFDGDLDAVELLYGAGVRMTGLVYDGGNALGCGLAQQTDTGLSRRGREYVTMLSRLGMVIDLSHAGERTSLDALRTSGEPVVISHAGARSVWPIPRLKTDRLLGAVADGGGLIGVSAAPHSTCSREHPSHSIESVMDHVCYLVDTVGIDHVGFGPDTFFGDHVGLHRLHDAGEPYPPYVPDEPVPTADPVQFVQGLENPGENFRNISQWLVKRGFSDEEAHKLLGRNALRVLTAGFGG